MLSLTWISNFRRIFKCVSYHRCFAVSQQVYITRHGVRRHSFGNLQIRLIFQKSLCNRTCNCRIAALKRHINHESHITVFLYQIIHYCHGNVLPVGRCKIQHIPKLKTAVIAAELKPVNPVNNFFKYCQFVPFEVDFCRFWLISKSITVDLICSCELILLDFW